jgi:acetyltransferase-like isoleucine patch superfamily enzyme
MPIALINNGKNNYVDVSDELLAKGTGKIVLDGDNNSFSIRNTRFGFGGFYHLSGGATVSLGEQINAEQLFVYASNGTHLKIGDRVSFNGTVRLLLHEPGRLTIGNDCLFASEVDITISDMHSVVDIASNQRINRARDVEIGNKVWVGQRAMVLKGVTIGDGSVIGAGSVVTKKIPPNCAAGGNPARLIRPNVSWDPRLL